MKIDTRAFLSQKGKHMQLEHTYDMKHLLQKNNQLLDISSVLFKGEGMLQAGIFLVKGEVFGKYTLACSRCLAELPQEFSQEIEERFHMDDKPLVNQIEDEEIHEVIGSYIELDPWIEEAVIISIPLFPSCTSMEECQNNLPQQGKHWSVQSDQQKEEKIDPRLAKLAQFFQDNEN